MKVLLEPSTVSIKRGMKENVNIHIFSPSKIWIHQYTTNRYNRKEQRAHLEVTSTMHSCRNYSNFLRSQYSPVWERERQDCRRLGFRDISSPNWKSMWKLWLTRSLVPEENFHKSKGKEKECSRRKITFSVFKSKKYSLKNNTRSKNCRMR